MRLEQESTTTVARGGFSLPRAFRVVRAAAGISQTEAARRAGVSNGAWSKAESGKTDPSFRVLGQIAAGHGLTLTQFLGLAMGLSITQKHDGTITAITALPKEDPST